MRQIQLNRNRTRKSPDEIKRIRELVHSMVGIVQNKQHEDSVEEVRKIRKELSKKDMDLDYINSL